MSIEKEIIDYSENEKDINHWVMLKGEYRYNKVIDFLKRNEIECTWNNVTYFIKYDKRLLINSFKYIVFLEELYKSILYNNSEKKNNAVLNYEFSKALNDFVNLKDKGSFDGMDLVTLSQEKKTIIIFRNCVVHNKILLNHLFNGKTLEDVLKIFVKILPMSYRQGFIKDINSCSNKMPYAHCCVLIK